jgi:hypothetical protein
VAVTQASWTTPEMPLRREPATAYLYPSGCAENRPSRQAAAMREELSQYEQRNIFSHVVCWTDWRQYAGHLVARRAGDRAVLEVIP